MKENGKEIIQKYITENIKHLTVERRRNKFYGTLTNEEGRTFEFSKDVTYIERFFDNTHKTFTKDTNIRKNMLLNCFQKLFIRTYVSGRLNPLIIDDNNEKEEDKEDKEK